MISNRMNTISYTTACKNDRKRNTSVQNNTAHGRNINGANRYNINIKTHAATSRNKY